MMKNDKRKGPLPFFQVGKNARDLLTNGFCGENKLFRVSTTTPSGVILTSTAARGGGDLSAAEVKAQYKYNGVSVDVEFHSLHEILARFTATAQILPSTRARSSIGLSTCSTSGGRRFTDYCSTRLDFLFSHPHATVCFTIPSQVTVIGIGASVGSRSISLGMEGTMEPAGLQASNGSFSVRTAAFQFTMLSAGFQVTKPTWDASLLVFRATNSNVLRASFFHHMNKEKKKISAGIEMIRNLSTHETLLIAGASWVINRLTIAKARTDSRGTVMTLLQHNIQDKACLSISAAVDTKDLSKKPAIGLAVVMEL